MAEGLQVRRSLRGGLPVARYDHRRQIVEAHGRQAHELTVDLLQVLQATWSSEMGGKSMTP